MSKTENNDYKSWERYITIAIPIAIGLPFVLNVLIRWRSPYSVVGEPQDWLLFYGSYIGGVLTAVIGIITLYQSAKRSDMEIKRKHQDEIIMQLRQSLVKCISIFDYSRVGGISLYIDSPSMYDTVLKDMDDYLHKLASVSNAWYVAFGNQDKAIAKEFQSVLQQCCSFITKNINRATNLMIQLRPIVIASSSANEEWEQSKRLCESDQSQENREHLKQSEERVKQNQKEQEPLLEGLKGVCDNHAEFEELLLSLCNKAHAWIAEEEAALKAI